MVWQLPLGTEYERLLRSLRLETPWAVGTKMGHEPLPSPRKSSQPKRPHESITVVPVKGSSDLVARTTEEVARLHLADAHDMRSACEVIDGFARSAPDAIALSCGSTQVTYGDIRLRTDRFAAILRSAGVRQNDVVLLVLGRGIPMIEAMIAVWKAGAAFLPVDPLAPISWQNDTADASGARVYVAAGDTAVLAGLVRIDIDADDLETGLAEPVPPGTADHELAYVIRTSGTSGTPKLVAVGQRAVSNLLVAVRNRVDGLGAGASVLQFSSPYFDGVVFDLLMGLGTGATLEVFEGLSGSPDIAKAIRTRGVTHTALPAAVVRTLVPADVPSLRVLLSVGDVCLTETAAAWTPHVTFINGYGPTETTVCATLHTVDPNALPTTTTVPIGTPVPGVHVVLADDDLNPVHEGATGEICVGGLGVAQNYLGRSEEFERRFPRDPYSPVRGARLYRTGDLGRRLPDGTIHFLGRRDDQVKVRGFRVEPAEVERVLVGLPAVAESVVLFAPSIDGGTLVGYVRPTASHEPESLGLISQLRELLPAHMIPSAIVVVDQWPLTENGKVDREKLPRPGVAAGREYVVPRTPVEHIVAAFAAKLLGLERVGIDDVFFDLGGHSLLATQLVAQVRTVLGKDLELSAVMTGATVAEIAATVEATSVDATSVPAPVPPGTRLVPSYMQRRVWLTHNIEPESVAYNAQGVLRLYGELDIDALEASLSSYVSRYDVLRSRFSFRDGELEFELDQPWRVDLPIIDLTGVSTERRDELLGAAIRSHVRTRFELSEGRLIRWMLFKTAEDEHLLAHVEHHAVHDGWSFNVYLYELIQGYCDHLKYGEVRRPVPPIQFHDYAVWQRQWLSSLDAERQRAYWQAELAGANTVLPLPVRPRAARRRFEGADPRFDIDVDLARRLDRFSRDNGVTLYMTMLAAYLLVLHRYSRSDDILIGSGFANRGWDGAENMVGMFINTVVVRGRLDGDPTFSELLDRVRTTCLNAHDNQDLPFEEVLGGLDVDRVAGMNPLIQASFTFHDVPHLNLEWMPLDITAIEGMSNGSAKFDLNVIAVPRFATPGHITCNPGNVVNVPRSDGPVSPSPRQELDGITLSWEYDKTLFDSATMSGMLDAYLAVLTTAIEEPDTVLSEFPLMSTENQEEVMAFGAGAQTATTGWLPALVGRWCREAPDRIAVECGGIRLTYGELGERATAVAEQLRDNGVAPRDVVALNVPRSCDLAVAVLAVLKLGATFFVLDSTGSDPQSVFADSGAHVTVVVPATRDLVPPGYPAVSAVEGATADRTFFDGKSNDIALLHYESRIGDKPSRAVEVTHSEVLAAVAPSVGTALLSGSAAAPAVILACLARGVTAMLVSPEETPTVLGIESVTTACLDVDVFRETTLNAPEAWGDVRRVVLNGRVPDPQLLTAVFAQGVTAVVGTYGLDRTGVFRTTHVTMPSDMASVEGGRPLPIGRPVPLANVNVVDERSRLAPFGMVGKVRVETASGQVHVIDDLAQWTITGVLELYGGPDAGSVGLLVDPATLEPVADTQDLVTRLVSEVLVVEEVDPHDNFFERGGDSLLAMGLLARLLAVFKVNVSLGEMLVDPTVAHLTAKITAAGAATRPTTIARRTRVEVPGQ